AHRGQGQHGSPADYPLRRAAADLEGRLHSGRGHLLPLEDAAAAGVEHLKREAVQPAAEIAVDTVVDADGFNRVFATQIALPPRVARALLRVRLPAIAVGAALVAVDAPRRVAAVRGVLLPGLALPRDVAALAEYFNFSERQCAIFAGQLDADEAAERRLAARHRGGQLLRQAVEQFRDLRVDRKSTRLNSS